MKSELRNAERVVRSTYGWSTFVMVPVALLALTLGSGSAASAQALKRHTEADTPAAAAAAGTPDRAASYYHYGLAHLYENLAVNAGRSDYATQAVEEYKLALTADPDSKLVADGLADLYFKLGRIREAVIAAKDQVAKDPNDLEAHQLLGKVYLRSLGDMQQGTQSNDMLQLALTEYQTIERLKPNDIETHLLLGQLYGLNHDSAKAESEFRLAQKIDANSEDVVLNMARLYSEKGELQRTIDVLKAVPVDDRTARIEFALAGSYDQTKDYKNAADAYQRALDLEPGNLDSERGLANALMNGGKLDEAGREFESVLSAEPNDVQSELHLSEIQRRQGHYDEALKTLQKAKAETQDNAELAFSEAYNEALIDDSLGHYDDAIAALNGLLDSTAHADGKYSEGEKYNRAIFLDREGIIFREQNRTAEAVAAYSKLIDMGGEYVARGYQGEVDAYRDAHDWKQATATAAQAAKALPKDTQVQLMYAGQLADTGKPEEGIALAKAQLTSSPRDRDVYDALGLIEMRQKHWNEAATYLDKAEALANDPAEKLYIYYLRGTMADQQKQYDQAEAEFEKALAIDPQNAAILNAIGYMNADRGVKLNEALEQIRKAVDLDPQNYAYLDSLGWVYFKLGQLPLATTNLQKAVERSSGDPTVHDHLGQVYEKTGKLKLAVAQWERSMTEYAHSLPADVDPADVSKVQHKLESARVKLAKLGPSERASK